MSPGRLSRLSRPARGREAEPEAAHGGALARAEQNARDMNKPMARAIGTEGFSLRAIMRQERPTATFSGVRAF